MTRTLLGAAIALTLLLVGGPEPATAGGALIETTAPLADRSEEGVKAAVVAAIHKAVRGAAAMGFAWFQLHGAQVWEDEVIVRITATDEGPDRAPEVNPDAGAPESGEERAGEPQPGRAAPGGPPSRIRI
jgi:hypothetical protein